MKYKGVRERIKTMGPLFWLAITDWKKEKDKLNISKPYIDRYFSTDWRKNKVLDLSFQSLKYFDNEVSLNVNDIPSHYKDLINSLPQIDYDACLLFDDYKKKFNYPDDSIITSRRILSNIMNTPFEVNHEKRKWIIEAELLKNDIVYLYCENDGEHNVQEFHKHYELLKRYLFVKKPIKYNRKVCTAFNEMFGELLRLKLDVHDIFYTTEILGVNSNHEISVKEELCTAEHIYFDIFDSDELPREVNNYNPFWWSNSTLINASKCIIASYDCNNECLKEIIKFNTDKFNEKSNYENIWSPESAWNFLNEFLNFVYETMHSVSTDIKYRCIWKFQSFLNDKPYVSCETFIRTIENGIETLKPLTLDASNFT
ncbi:hypothetical protein O3M35_004971 [Rhynocoris fuscipes]|uniref:Decapping nuclease n=1 Tax=Rhynocoris fuscipes TaxID=488301 RepID=A0AAW1DIY0_9HEMI